MKTEIDTGVLREQFLAVVGHDLRSPLQAATLVSDALQLPQSEIRHDMLVTQLKRSIVRMSGLVDDVMDFARAKLGSGIPLQLCERSDLQRIVEMAAEEVRQGHPHCRIEFHGEVKGNVRFDDKRMRQLFANLLNNAVTHGDPNHPIEIRLEQSAGFFNVAVANKGDPISPDIIGQLFEPFVRPASSGARPGLGLGLYIASNIAAGHSATLSVTSTDTKGTVFSLAIPSVLTVGETGETDSAER